MKAWVTKETVNEAGKTVRQKAAEGVKGVKPGDMFVVEWYSIDATGRRHRHREKIRTLLPDDSKGTNAKAAKRQADEMAQAKGVDLRRGGNIEPAAVTWADFRSQYESEVLTGLAPKTALRAGNVFRAIERILAPKWLADITAARLSHYQSEMRKTGRAEATIKAHVAHLKPALKWAASMGLLASVPAMKMPQRAKGQKMMKGRPITLEEFERMLDVASKVVGDNAADSWRYYLRGLWWSGLRLAESLELYWDERNDKLHVVTSERRPMLYIPSALEKGNQDRLWPMAPEFAEFLRDTPERHRKGRVFSLESQRGRGDRVGTNAVGGAIRKIGRKAGVKVNDRPTKYASAHDLRRSFGFRWSDRVMPQVLMVLMRHEDIETTLRYYVGKQSQQVAETLWTAYEKTKTPACVEARGGAEHYDGF